MRVVGVDIGGTFTDFMLYDTESGAVHVHKVRSTPDDPGRALVEGLGEICGQAGVEAADVGGVFHGTIPWRRTPCSSTAGRSAGS